MWATDECDRTRLCAGCLLAAAAREVGGELPEWESAIRVLTDRNYGQTDDEREYLAGVVLTGLVQVREQLASAQAGRDQARAYVAAHVQGHSRVWQHELDDIELLEDEVARLRVERDEARHWARTRTDESGTRTNPEFPSLPGSTTQLTRPHRLSSRG